jgi:hypothetical protein
MTFFIGYRPDIWVHEKLFKVSHIVLWFHIETVNSYKYRKMNIINQSEGQNLKDRIKHAMKSAEILDTEEEEELYPRPLPKIYFHEIKQESIDRIV